MDCSKFVFFIMNIQDKKIGELRDADIARKAARPGNEAWLVSRKRAWLYRGILVASGLLHAAAFPPLNWSVFGWIGIIPLFFLVREMRSWQAWRAGFLWGYAWSCAAFFWIREIEIFIPFLLSFVLALFPAFWAMAVPLLERYLFIPVDVQLKGHEAEQSYLKEGRSVHVRETVFVFALASWWCVLEWIRTWIGTGLPWNLLGVSQWKNSAVIQIAEYTGVYGVSFILAFFNLSLALAVEKWRKSFFAGKFSRPVPFYISLVLIMISVAGGSSALLKRHALAEKVKMNIAIIQGDIPQCRMADDEQARFALEEYLKLSNLAVLSNAELVIWPETAVPIPYLFDGSFGMKYRFELGEIIRKSGIPFLIGTIDFAEIPEKISGVNETPVYNGAILLNPQAKIVGRYHKMHLVPFGEYTPFGEYYTWLKRKFGMGRSLAPGKKYTIFNLKEGLRAAVNICYEDVFPEISRQFALRSANLLIVLTNDAWYPKSSEPEQHLSHAVFRAVETRLPVLRSGNNSGSCVISSGGIISDSITFRYDEKLGRSIPDPLRKSKGYAVFQVETQKNPSLTFYVRYGNVFVYFCGMICLFTGLYILWQWREKKEALIKGNL